jgi:DNA-binding LacI/PurR family transcriptional regulator
LRGDDVQGIEAAIEHLYERGFRRPAYVGGPASASDVTRREAAARTVKRLGFRNALRSYVSRAEPWQVDTAVTAILVKNKHDAVLCFDDKLALSLMEGLRAGGTHVPGAIALVGFDDIPFARLANPSLTTIAQPSTDLGRRAVAMLLEAIRTGTMPRSERLPVHLVVRESTGRNGTAESGRPRRRPAT